MKLRSVRVTNFRSVDDSGEFKIDEVTCLVGKNEAGKSAVLLALAALNPHDSTPILLNKERDYPRRFLTQFDERHPDGAVAISTKWELTSDEVREIEKNVTNGVLQSPIVSITRSYGEPIKIDAEISYATVVEGLKSKFALNAAERAPIASPTTSTELQKSLESMATRTEKHEALLKYLKDGNALTRVNKLIGTFLPKFMYMSAYDRMAGAIQIEDTIQKINDGRIDSDEFKSQKLFAEFLEYAGVEIKEITSVDTYETFAAKLQAASNNITDQILEYWTQNPDLNVNVKIEPGRSGDEPPLNSGSVGWARVYNGLHRVDTPFSERSAGFVWFFSFLVKFAKVKFSGEPVILLLDEPGLTLHGKAQADLLRFFDEKLAPHHQIVFSTHSPFMVPANKLADVRVVEDQVTMQGSRRVPLGTKVHNDVLATDPDTLFPLQGALGYELTQSLFIGTNTLLVEGPSDVVYLQTLSNKLKENGKVGLDSRWTICPTGGIDKIMPFVSLFGANALNVAVLSDQAKGDKSKIERVRAANILQSERFFTFADLLDKEEGDVEDVFDPKLFAEILNRSYGLKGSNKLTPKKLSETQPSTGRLVKQAEQAFRLMPDTVAAFDHYAPASWLTENSAILNDDISGETLSRAQGIFDKYNAMLD